MCIAARGVKGGQKIWNRFLTVSWWDSFIYIVFVSLVQDTGYIQKHLHINCRPEKRKIDTKLILTFRFGENVLEDTIFLLIYREKLTFIGRNLLNEIKVYRIGSWKHASKLNRGWGMLLTVLINIFHALFSNKKAIFNIIIYCYLWQKCWFSHFIFYNEWCLPFCMTY